MNLDDAEQLVAHFVPDAELMFFAGVPWEQFYAEILGPDGSLRLAVDTAADREYLQRTESYWRIRSALRGLRTMQYANFEHPESWHKRLHVKMPPNLFLTLQAEARRQGLNVTRLVLDKITA